MLDQFDVYILKRSKTLDAVMDFLDACDPIKAIYSISLISEAGCDTEKSQTFKIYCYYKSVCVCFFLIRSSSSGKIRLEDGGYVQVFFKGLQLKTENDFRLINMIMRLADNNNCTFEMFNIVRLFYTDESDVKNEIKRFGDMIRNMMITLEALK